MERRLSPTKPVLFKTLVQAKYPRAYAQKEQNRGTRMSAHLGKSRGGVRARFKPHISNHKRIGRRTLFPRILRRWLDLLENRGLLGRNV